MYAYLFESLPYKLTGIFFFVRKCFYKFAKLDSPFWDAYCCLSKLLFGGTMLEVTEKAMTEFKNYFADKDKSPIRIYLAAGG
jgi:hypothetical protein